MASEASTSVGVLGFWGSDVFYIFMKTDILYFDNERNTEDTWDQIHLGLW